MIKYGGNTEDLTISWNTPIIGQDEKNIYHIMFKTDYNKLNHWETLIEILLERFIIRNPKGNERPTNNKTKFEGKQIQTYLFILKQNRYELFDWKWDGSLNKELLNECKQSIIQKLSVFNKQIFEYYNFIKNKNEKWKPFSSPLEYIANNALDLPVYVTDFFKYLHQQTKTGKLSEVIELTNTEKLFCEKMNSQIEQMCDRFFGINLNELGDVVW